MNGFFGLQRAVGWLAGYQHQLSQNNHGSWLASQCMLPCRWLNAAQDKARLGKKACEMIFWASLKLCRLFSHPNPIANAAMYHIQCVLMGGFLFDLFFCLFVFRNAEDKTELYHPSYFGETLLTSILYVKPNMSYKGCLFNRQLISSLRNLLQVYYVL